MEAATAGQERSGAELIGAAANPREAAKLTQQEQQDATAWLLSDEPSAAPTGTRVMEVDVGTDEKPIVLQWTLKGIDGDELRRIQNRLNTAPRGPRAGRQEPDELEYHAAVLVAGTVDPDVKAIAREKGAANAATFVRQRFSHKPGLIPQMTAVIMELSGFDDSDVREVVESGKD